MQSIKAKDIMTPNPRMIKPTQTVQEAAKKAMDAGCEC